MTRCPPIPAQLSPPVLEELEHDGDDGGEPPVPEYQRLAPVAHQVRHDEDVHLVLHTPQIFLETSNIFRESLSSYLHVVPRIARVVRIVQTTVAAVILLGYFLTKILINIPSQSRVKCQWRIIMQAGHTS